MNLSLINIDSRRLALYAIRNADRLKPTPALHCSIMPLKDLLMVRNKLIVQTRSLETALKELKQVSISANDTAALKKLLQPALKGLQQSLKHTEQKIKDVLKQDEAVYKTYKLLNTIPGIGHVTAVYLICCSNMFTMCNSGKQLACYAGVVPFDYQSGTSIKGKHHVHKMANKELKRLLHMCALTSIKNHKEFKDYYERKKQEGKHAMSILNAIKACKQLYERLVAKGKNKKLALIAVCNKLLKQVFAVVNNQTMFNNNYLKNTY